MENKENPNLDKNDINQDTSQASEKQLDDENLEAKKDTEEQQEEGPLSAERTPAWR